MDRPTHTVTYNNKNDNNNDNNDNNNDMYRDLPISSIITSSEYIYTVYIYLFRCRHIYIYNYIYIIYIYIQSEQYVGYVWGCMGPPLKPPRSVDGKKGGGPELVKFMEEASNSFELAP